MTDPAGMTEWMTAKITTHSLTYEEALVTLQNDAFLRCIRETLAKYCGITDEDELKAFLLEALQQCSPNAQPASLRRKVRMWMSNDTYTIKREGAMQLVFSLKLDVDRANAFLILTCEEGFHMRSPEDIIFVYALQQGMTYPEALALFERMKAKGLTETDDQTEPFVYTHLVKEQAMALSSEQELEAFLRESQAKLGSLHNTAYQMFMGFLQLLQLEENRDVPSLNFRSANGTKEADPMEDLALPMRGVLDTYMYNALIPRVERGENKEAQPIVLSALQRNIRQNWPNEFELSNMIKRKADVTRKTLILLFLATDGGDGAYGAQDMTPKDVFEDVSSRLNSMLIDCSFAPLDARVQFDWMVLYCICSDDVLLTDGRVQRFLHEVFPEQKIEQTLTGFYETDQLEI